MVLLAQETGECHVRGTGDVRAVGDGRAVGDRRAAGGAGLPFGPEAGVPERVGVPDILACSLEVGSLLAALALWRSTRWLVGRSPASSHVQGLAVVALVCMTVIGVCGSGLSWFDAFGISAAHSATGMRH